MHDAAEAADLGRQALGDGGAATLDDRPPTPWPSAVSRSANDAVSGAVNGSIECAAAPASSTRAASVEKRRVAYRTEGVPTAAKHANVSGWAGMLRMGRST